MQVIPDDIVGKRAGHFSFFNYFFSQLEQMKRFPLYKERLVAPGREKKIIEEAEMTGPFSDNIIRDYLHIFLLESKRIILPAGVIEDNTSDYYLLQQFYKLIKSTYPIIKSVDAAAGALSVRPHDYGWW